MLRRLALLVCLGVVTTASTRAEDVPPALEAKLDRAIALTAEVPGFELYHDRLRALRKRGDVYVTTELPSGTLAEAYGDTNVAVGAPLLKEKDVRFVAAALVHEAVHLGQDGDRYANVIEPEYKAYRIGGRFKERVGLPMNEIEKAANRLTRDGFVWQAAILFHAWQNREGRATAPVLDRSSLSIAEMPDLRHLARINRVPGYRTRSHDELVSALESRYNAGGLEGQSVDNLRRAARALGVDGASTMRKAELVRSLAGRLSPDRLGIFTFRELRERADRLGVPKRGLRSRESLTRAIVERDAVIHRRVRQAPRASRARARARP